MLRVLGHNMSKYFSVVILDGISITVSICMASDSPHEEISVFVELERFDEIVQLMFAFCWQQIKFVPKHKIPRLMASESPELKEPKNLAPHCAHDKPIAFLVTGVAGTKKKVYPVYSSLSQRILFLPKTTQKNLLLG